MRLFGEAKLIPKHRLTTATAAAAAVGCPVQHHHSLLYHRRATEGRLGPSSRPHPPVGHTVSRTSLEAAVAAAAAVKHESSSCVGRGSISKAKQVLAHAMKLSHQGYGDDDASETSSNSSGYHPCLAGSSDTGVLGPLLSIIRNTTGQCISCSSSLASSSSNSSSAGVGFRSGSRLSRGSADGSDSSSGASSSAAAAAGGRDFTGSCSCQDAAGAACIESLPQQQVLLEPGQVRCLLDAIDTVCFLATDEANMRALVDLGAVPLLISKFEQPGAAGEAAAQVQAAALKAVAALAKRQDEGKHMFWLGPGGTLLLQLLSSKIAGPLLLSAHAAAAVLGFGACTAVPMISPFSNSWAGSNSRCCGSSSSSSRLLEPRIVSALAGALHPGADTAVLLSALGLLRQAAGAVSPGVKVPGWRQVVFALVPLLMPSRRRCQAEVLEACLDLMLALTDQQELRNLICASGCLPPLLALLLDDSEQRLGAQAGCLLTTLVDCPLCQERLKEEPALVLLLRVLAGASQYSCEVQLAATHTLRRLAAGQPGSVALLKVHGAVPVLYELLAGNKDADVWHCAAGLLKALGVPVRRANGHRHHHHHHHHAQEQQLFELPLVQENEEEVQPYQGELPAPLTPSGSDHGAL